MAHKCDGCRYKGEHQEMMFRPFGVCTRELNLVEAEKAYNAEKCPYKKTNADRIRAMTDEELEAFLVDVDLDKVGSPFITEWGKWLKKPAEVDDA